MYRPKLTVTPTSRPPTSSEAQRPPSSASSARPPSSSSLRPPSSASLRPSQSAPLRPPSSASQRPPSALSANRPASSASVRSASRISLRPASRISLRPATRQSTRILPNVQTLVTQISGITADNDEEEFQALVESVSRNLDYRVKAAPGSNMSDVEKQIKGRARKARINSEDAWAHALETSYTKLKIHMQQASTDLDEEIKLSRLPDHVHLLMLLSQSADEATLQQANEYLEGLNNPVPKAPTLTWKDILDEEPFEGQHWEGVYGLPTGSTVEGWETKSLDSTPPLSPLDSGGQSDLVPSISSSESLELEEEESFLPRNYGAQAVDRAENRYAYHQEVEDLQSKQYWRTEWKPDFPISTAFDIGDASSFGPAISRALNSNASSLRSPGRERYIYEHDAVREVLMSLQGRQNLMLRWSHHSGTVFLYEPIPNAPRLSHLSLTAQNSILESFAGTATVIEHLRKYTSSILAQAIQMNNLSDQTRPFIGRTDYPNRTLQAFCDAVDAQIRNFDSWCAAREQDIGLARAGVGAPLVISLLSLQKQVRDSFARVFDVLLDITRRVMRQVTRIQDTETEIWMLAELPARMAPSAITTFLLDTLLSSVQEQVSMDDMITSDALMRVFSVSAEPTWRMVGRWLHDGMPILNQADQQKKTAYGTLDQEFFIEDNELMILDPDFWTEGYVLRNDAIEQTHGSKSVPMFLVHVADSVLGAGKSIGLLRALGIPVTVDDEPLSGWAHQWPSFTTLAGDASRDQHTFSVEDLSHLVYDGLQPHCHAVQSQLTRVIVEDCCLWEHLTVIEDVYLMRRGDVMARLADAIFAKMDNNQMWSDFHFLNSVFRDITTGSNISIDASLIRLSYRGGKDKAANRSVRAFEGLCVEYAAPFPLTYIFGPRATQIYSSVFVFLLQIRRAKSVLERILVRGAVKDAHAGSDLKMLYAMRSRLSWFVNVLLDFIATYVIHAQLTKFHDAMRRAQSLDEVIQLHQDHLDKLEDRCFLHSNSSSLRRAVHSIIDMALHFNDRFVAFAGDTTLDISRHSLQGMKKHRSRRLQRQRRDAIGFSQSLREATAISSDSDSDSEDEDEDAMNETAIAGSYSLAATMSSPEEGIGRIDKMSSELDSLVRFVRRSVESMAGGTGDAAPTFGIFAFALEDWDK